MGKFDFQKMTMEEKKRAKKTYNYYFELSSEVCVIVCYHATQNVSSLSSLSSNNLFTSFEFTCLQNEKKLITTESRMTTIIKTLFNTAVNNNLKPKMGAMSTSNRSCAAASNFRSWIP